MILLGLLGNPLSKSLSPDIFSYISEKKKIEIEFNLFETSSPEETVKELRRLSYNGFFITTPFKETLYNILKPKLMFTDFNIINCVKFSGSDIIATNTDFIALKILSSVFSFKNRTALLLGSGATAVTSLHLLRAGGIKKVYISARNLTKAAEIKNRFDDIDIEIFDFNRCFKKYDILVNATPVGMYYNESITTDFLNTELVIDWPYSKGMTELVKDARANNIKSISGIEILVVQAIIGFEFITGYNFFEDKDEIIEYVSQKVNTK
ncbi:MAG: hypothetical protein KA059_08625 [Elusimicrobiales bacterium]|nr:hypothetical protein [Elusimicrobiales bacterium]